ncbi:HPr family phosphocarrier protein, partial [Planctomycetota bacterium]
IINRPLLGELFSQSTQLEEFLDAYGAGYNCKWCGLRSLTAAIKGFSDIGYELLHIKYVLPDYRLLPTGQDFTKATEQTFKFASDILLRICRQFIIRTKALGLSVPTDNGTDISYPEELPDGCLPHLCERRQIEIASKTVTLLATAFLNLAAESRDVCAAARAKPEKYPDYLAGSVSEEKLRSLQLSFHNLQSLYDTYISGTEAAELDEDLPVLRGHISIVMHLLKMAMLFAHHYERHLKKQRCTSPTRQAPLLSTEELLSVLMNYSITYTSLFIDCAVQLCQEKLKRYAEVVKIELPIPRYRGFHVRPSTLIAKLVQHYGSEVKMQLDNEIYNARLPLDLFRANEKINARKRKWLTEEIVRLRLVQEEADDDNLDIEAVVLGVVLTLAGRAKLIIYEQPLQLPEAPARKQGAVLEKIVAEMARLLAMGKIDVEACMNVTFSGDKRVLNDIKLLAQSGYGEDKFGNNVPLPEKLRYLRR